MPRSLRSRVDLRFLRYVLAGGLVSAIYTTTTSLLILLAHLPVALAIAIGYFVGVTVHFNLHRGFVFAGRGDFALEAREQLWRYVLVVVVQYLVTTGLVALLVHNGGLPKIAAFLVATAIVTPVTFVLMRARLFHAAAPVARGPAR